MYSYLKCIAYNKLLKPRQSFLITLYTWSEGLEQCFPTFVRTRLGKFFFHKRRARSEQIYS
jgi:hypothetical protein